MRAVSPSVLLALVLVLSACSGEPDATAPTTAPPTGTPTAGTDTPTAPDSPPASPTSPAADAPTTTEPVPLGDARASWQEVGAGFEGPVQVLPVPGVGPVVVEQAGRLQALDGGTLLDLSDRVTVGGERGLLGAAVHPDGDRLFVHYSGADGQTVLSSFPLSDGTVDPAEETVLFSRAQPAANHNGGALLFDPEGMLVLALGDGGGGGDQFGNGQDPGTVLGALLRFDADGPSLEPAPGNPFLDGGGAPEVWAYGLRNPWRIAFDQDRLYVADVGQDAVEEVAVVDRDEVAGANFGWPIVEGSRCFRAEDCDTSGLVLPVAELRHDEGACGIIGGVVVPTGHPSGLGGAYLYSDLCDTQLRALRVGDGEEVETSVVDGATLPASPLGFGTGEDGQVCGTAASSSSPPAEVRGPLRRWRPGRGRRRRG